MVCIYTMGGPDKQLARAPVYQGVGGWVAKQHQIWLRKNCTDSSGKEYGICMGEIFW